ncbi:hypothetical protein FB451DRAFT_142236 [Mycena latifolia]|nr:hypothetical protein FB451DRAFT_142236 [Mycena latifolia]
MHLLLPLLLALTFALGACAASTSSLRHPLPARGSSASATASSSASASAIGTSNSGGAAFVERGLVVRLPGIAPVLPTYSGPGRSTFRGNS